MHQKKRVVKTFDLDQILFLLYRTHAFESKHFHTTTSSPLQICKLRLLAIGDRLSEQFRSRITPTPTPCNQYSFLNCFIPQRSLTYTVVTVASVDSPSDPIHCPWFLVSAFTHSSQAQAATVTPQTHSPTTTTAGLPLLWNLCGTGLWSQFICDKGCKFPEISILICHIICQYNWKKHFSPEACAIVWNTKAGKPL